LGQLSIADSRSTRSKPIQLDAGVCSATPRAKSGQKKAQLRAKGKAPAIIHRRSLFILKGRTGIGRGCGASIQQYAGDDRPILIAGAHVPAMISRISRSRLPAGPKGARKDPVPARRGSAAPLSAAKDVGRTCRGDAGMRRSAGPENYDLGRYPMLGYFYILSYFIYWDGGADLRVFRGRGRVWPGRRSPARLFGMREWLGECISKPKPPRFQGSGSSSGGGVEGSS